MSYRNQFLLKGVAGILILWAVVFGVLKAVGSIKPTPEKVMKYGRDNPLAEIDDPDERREVIGNIAEMLNQLEPDELSELEGREEGDPRREFFGQMTQDEQMFFMEKRIGRAFQQIMLSFNEMDREERKKIVERSLKQMEENPNGPRGEGLEEADPEMIEKITTAGFKSYYQDANADTKLDLAPLMEQMQKNMSRMGGGGRRK